jgi:hypothetical protein
MNQSNPFPVVASQTWKRVYECAFLELDKARLPERIAEARTAIFDRAEEVMTQPSSDEHRALNQALRTLRALEDTALRNKNAA